MTGSSQDVELDPVAVEFKLTPPFSRNEGNCWIARLPERFQAVCDTGSQPRRSPFLLTENGSLIGLPHTLHRDIAQRGGGLFSHWAADFYFSASDNSDPNHNGRAYAIVLSRGAADPELVRLMSPESKPTGSVASPAAPSTAPETPAHPAPTGESADSQAGVGAEAVRAGPTSRPFGPRQDVDQCSGIVAVFGSSYCGSTLVNVMLGAHPEIFAGGELHWVLAKPDGTVCAICGEHCRYWTLENRRSLTAENFYHQLSRIFGRRIIVDSSKMHDWFGPMLPRFSDVPQSKVLIVKHPIRHAASFVEKARLGEIETKYLDVDIVLYYVRVFYQVCLGNHDFDRIIRYEDLVKDPQGILADILAPVGLQVAPGMHDWKSAECHMIGGNSGPRAQVSNIPPTGEFRQRKYKRSGVFLDDSYAETLSIEEVERVALNEDARWIKRTFGYA